MGNKLKILGLPKNKCNHCGHIWVSRINPPKICPKCHSVKIDFPQRIPSMRKCAKCKYEWRPRIENPKLCPGCGTPYWKGAERDKNGDIIRN